MRFSAVKSAILAAGFDNGKIIIWDVQSATKRAELQAHSQTPCSQLAFSPVNNLLLTSCGYDGKIQFFDISSQKNVKTIYTKGSNNLVCALTSIAFCHDGFTIAVGSINGKIFINNLKDKTKQQIEIND
jgi:WD40 repeat protein